MLPNRWMDTGWKTPFDGLLRFRNEIDRVFDRMQGEGWNTWTDDSWGFPVDMTETGHEYRYTFEVRGFAREDLDVTLENGVLTVEGERHAPTTETAEGDTRTHRRGERRYGRFLRSVRLPTNALVDEVDATCENGLLTVSVPKSAEARPRRIEIESGRGQRQLTGSTT